MRDREAPPLGLTPGGTLLGLRSGVSERHEISRSLPPGMALAGEFIAAAGWIAIERERPQLRLRAVVQTAAAGAAMQHLRAICQAWPEGQFIE